VLALVLADLVDRDDIRVRKAGRRLGFSLEALDRVRRRHCAGADELERDDAVEAHLPRLEDHAYATACDFLEQFVITEVAQPCAGE
jgi:hypothetical protein